MGLEAINIAKFRCLDSVDLEADQAVNLLVGPNGAGKTSILESIYYLGRGRSFRTAQSSALIQTGAEAFTVVGRVSNGGGNQRLGVRLGRGKTEIHLDGRAGTAADLAAALPVQVIEPEVHQLVQGGPDTRRRFMDWGVFHVKHQFLISWRRYRRALKQRNAALRSGARRGTVQAWDPELVDAGMEVDHCRRDFIGDFEPELANISVRLFGLATRCRYLSGWPEGKSFTEALDLSWAKDQTQGSTQVGPHRAELKLLVDDHGARHRLSRGQQKLLGAALILAQTRFVSSRAGIRVTLLVDEPAAELDGQGLASLLELLFETDLQLFLSALESDVLPLPVTPRMFHVEHGKVGTLL